MKVAFVTQPYDGVLPPRQNSIGLIVYNTALEVARQADVRLYLRHADGVAPDGTWPFEVAPTRSRSDDLILALAQRYPRWTRRIGLTERADAHRGWAGSVARALQSAPVDVVHVMNYWGWSRSLRHNRVVLEMQSEWLSQMPRKAVAEQLQHVSAVVAVSGHVERLFRAAFPDYGGQVAVVHNGVDTDTFCPPPICATKRPRSIIFVGRLSPEKGVHTLIEAFAKLTADHPDLRLDLVGPRTELPRRFLVELSDDPLVRALGRFYAGEVSDDYQAQLDAMVLARGLQDRVTFHGSLPHREIVALYQRASLVVNPSLSETFGISIVEGMACGVPVVGTHVGGMIDTIVNDVGRAVPAEDPAALAAAMTEVLGDEGLGRTLGARGRERALQHFTWRARASALMDIYRRAAGRP